GQLPAGTVALDVLDLVAEVDGGSRSTQRVGQVRGEAAEVDVGAGDNAGGGDLLRVLAALGDQRGPFVDGVQVVGDFQFVEQRVRLQGLVAGRQVLGVLIADHKGHVRQGVDERVVRDALVFDGPRVELAGDLE